MPIFPRTKKFANPYAFVAVDVLLTILWFAASIAVTTWVNAGVREGEKQSDDKKLKGCAAFAYGPESKCSLSRATVAMGVVIMFVRPSAGVSPPRIKSKANGRARFLFIVTSVISIRALMHFRKHGSLPTASSPSRASDPIEDQTKYAFSSNPHDEFDDDLEDRTARPPPRRDDNEYALLHTNTEDGTHPGRPLSWGREHAPSPFEGENLDTTDTSYHGGGGAGTSRNRTADHPTGLAYLPALPPAGTHVNPSDGSSGRYHGVGTPPPRLPRYELTDPFGDEMALGRHDGRSTGGWGGGSGGSGGSGGGGGRVEFPPAEYQR